MIIKEIENLEINPATGLYDLTVKTISDETSKLKLLPFTLTSRHEMRIDLLAEDLYLKADEIMPIMKLNDIVNPLSIKEGMVVYYVSVQDLDVLKRSDQNFDKIKNALINTGKAQKIDSARAIYLKEKGNLPITAKNTPAGNVTETGTSILIGPDF